jgi:hypothetical protein
MRLTGNGRTVTLMLVLAVLMGGAGAWAAAELEVTLDSVPEPARKMLEEIHDSQSEVTRRIFHNQQGGERFGAISRVTKDKEDGVDTYQAEWQVAGMDHSATVTDSGAVVETEAELPAARVPEPVKAAIATKFGKDADASYARVMTLTWDVEVNIGGKTHYVTVLPTGKIDSDEVGNGN